MTRMFFATAVALTVLFGAPNADAQTTIADVVADSGGTFDNNLRDYDILLTALQTASLVSTLDDDTANFTVFAPNDRAFLRLATDLGFTGTDEAGAWLFLVDALTTLGNGDPVAPLTTVLTYHVSPETVTPFGLIIRTIFGADIDTVEGNVIEPFFFFLGDQDPDNATARVAFPLNIQTDNGRIHTINRVLLPLDL